MEGGRWVSVIIRAWHEGARYWVRYDTGKGGKAF